MPPPPSKVPFFMLTNSSCLINFPLLHKCAMLLSACNVLSAINVNSVSILLIVHEREMPLQKGYLCK